jgi:hypothetical protein
LGWFHCFSFHISHFWYCSSDATRNENSVINEKSAKPRNKRKQAVPKTGKERLLDANGEPIGFDDSGFEADQSSILFTSNNTPSHHKYKHKKYRDDIAMSSSSMMMPPLPKSHGLTPNFMHMGIDFGKFESPSGVLGSMLDMDSPDNIGFSPFIMSYSSPSVKSGTLQTLNIHGIEVNYIFLVFAHL